MQRRLLEPLLNTQVNMFVDDAARIMRRLKMIEREDLLRWIKVPKTTFKFNIPLRRDNGVIELLQGFRVHHSYHATPCFGGLRYSPLIAQGDIEGLAALTTYRNACHDLPFGGSWGGIKINPKKFSVLELQRITHRYTMELARKCFLGSSQDVCMVDYGTSSREMSWVKDAFGFINRQKDINPSCVASGKPLSQDGVEGFSESAAIGIISGLKYIEKLSPGTLTERGLSNSDVIIMGYGQVGVNLHWILQECGCNIVGIVESNSGIYNPNGLDFKEVYAFWNQWHTLKGFSKAKISTDTNQQEIIFKKCDILFPAATKQSISELNMEKLQCKSIVEAANCSITYNAQRYFDIKNIFVLPDVLINAGSSIASYLEWLKGIKRSNLSLLSRGVKRKSFQEIIGASHQNIKSLEELPEQTEKSILHSAIDEIICSSIEQVLKRKAEHQNFNMRSASYSISIEKLLKEYNMSGTTI